MEFVEMKVTGDGRQKKTDAPVATGARAGPVYKLPHMATRTRVSNISNRNAN